MNAVVAFPTPAEKTLGDQFRARGATDAGRQSAYAAFSAAGLPHRRIEAWHYTDLRSLLREVLPPAPPPEAAVIAEAKRLVATLPRAEGGRVVLIDGVPWPRLSELDSLAAGVSARPILEAISQNDDTAGLVAAESLGAVESVVSLNAALLQGGVLIDVAAGAVSAPIEVLCIASGTTPAAIYARHYVRLGEGAKASIVERHAALQPTRSQANHVLVMALADGAELQHAAGIDGLGEEALHIGSMLVRLGARANFTSTTLIATRGITRRQAYLDFAGPHARAHFNGASLLDGRAHADTTLVVTHTAPHCESRELYKHVLDAEATGVYQGKVIVRPGAQKTDGKMLSKAVFLGDGATMHNKPELEIFADDVVCGHGATVGALDEDQLFYLRARGIPRAEAEAMLLEAFAEEALDELADEALREEFAGRIAQWLRQRGT
ncbi:MAG TPA: Fe-S cluster assembly protein SufD [Lichenihabitans sp.]|jgi:Fe-S cluster assembly protein SufD|nr:Fe-S cluster assembly protein SufD [Lichenihabitans sp.]